MNNTKAMLLMTSKLTKNQMADMIVAYAHHINVTHPADRQDILSYVEHWIAFEKAGRK